jgi:site-specific recombinase XerD
MKMVKEVLGHRDISTTVNIYGGVLESSLFKEMTKLNFKA